MGFQIEDGLGTGRSTQVTDENKLAVESVSINKISAASDSHGSAYFWTAYQDWGADKNAIWLRSDNNDEKLFIEDISISPASAAVIEVWVGTGNTSGGTTVTGVNLNRASGATAEVTCKHTNTNVDAGAGMTLLATYHCPATTVTTINLHDALVLGRNDELAVNIVTDVGATAVNIEGYFHD